MNKYYKMGENALHVLKDVSLEVKKGEFLAILGPSGSGKSTLMNMIGGMDVPDSGEYYLDGVAIHNTQEKKLADEPTGALDTASGQEVLKLFGKLNDMGNTIVMITHDLNVAQHAGRVVRIVDGELFEEQAV